MRISYTLGLFLGASLLFLVQPMAAKMLLPSLGGSPSVWITCMVFFQAMLLAGYGYSHLLTSRLAPRAQLALHASVVLLPILVLPLRIAPESGAIVEARPVLWLLRTLAASLGLPFFVLATTGPLLQRWFAATDAPGAANPYFFYATSNLGSLAALLSYPLLIEPSLHLFGSGASLWPVNVDALSQSLVWSQGYLLFALVVLSCGVLMLRRLRAADGPPRSRGTRSSWPARLRWIALAFVPSSAMLGATQYLTTDIAAVPLLWVLPLALYLLTFILAFSRRMRVPLAWSSPALAILVVGVAASMWAFDRPPVRLGLALHLATVVAVGLVCHGRLWEDRPPPERLTEYYLWIAFGGMLGGVFNALVAPVVFPAVIEYPIALVLACLMRPARTTFEGGGRLARVLDVAAPAGLALIVIGMRALPPWGGVEPGRAWVEIGVGACLCLILIARPLRFALGVAVLLVAGWTGGGVAVETVHSERTFFGVLQVKRFEGTRFRFVDDPERVFRYPAHVLFHGTTRHGTQMLDPKLRYRASSYFHISGPIGHLFRTFRGSSKLDSVAVVGLGAGTLAVYGEPGQSFTFYEIDPAVVRVAQDPNLFTYLAHSRAELRMIVADGRIGLSRARDGEFGTIVLDAFSSDAMPVHLMTREAVELYFRKLRPDGILVFNLTSQYFDLPPVVAAIAEELGLAGLVWNDLDYERWLHEGKEPSTFAVLARGPQILAALRAEPRWIELRRGPRSGHGPAPVWTDDSSSILSVLRR